MINIYALFHPVTGELRYIGKTNRNVKERLREHIKNHYRLTNHTATWLRSLIKQGLLPEIEVIDVVEVKDWEFWEQFYIAYFKSLNCRLLNHTIGGNVTPAITGRKLSKEHINKLKIAFKGLKRKDTSNFGVKKKIPILQFSKNGILIKEYTSAIDAYKETGVWKESIRNCMNGRSKSAGGFIWKYK